MIRYLSWLCTGLVLAALSGSAKAQRTPERSTGDKSPTAAQPAVPPTSTAQPAAASPAAAVNEQLSQACEAYRNTPSQPGIAQVVHLIEQVLSQTSPKAPAAAISSANRAFSDMGARALDTGNGRLWFFSRLPQPSPLILQWSDAKTNISYTGRRHRVKHVTTTVSWHVGIIVVPPSVKVEQAHLLGSGEGTHTIVLVGSENGANLWLRTYKQAGANWVESDAGRLGSIPAFLTSNTSGKISFRGPDLIFSVGRVVSARSSGAATNLPETESATYRFWLHLSDSGYVLQQRLPDEDQFWVVRQFLEALAQSRTDTAKALLADARLLSIPKYLGIRGAQDNWRLVQMASPPSGAPRFRVITGQKDDVIFEVARIKDHLVIRAIFIAAPDPFLQEIAANLPTYGKVAPGSNPPGEQVSVEKH